MSSITIIYRLTDKGQRDLLKTTGTTGTQAVIEVTPQHQIFALLADIVNLETLRFYCANSSRSDMFDISILGGIDGVHIYTDNRDLAIESDRVLTESDYPKLAHVLLLTSSVSRQISVLVAETTEKLKAAAHQKDVRIEIKTAVPSIPFTSLIQQLTDNTYVPELKIRYFWTSKSKEVLLKAKGWESMPSASEIAETYCTCEVYSAEDFLMDNYSPRVIERQRCGNFGTDHECAHFVLPCRDEFLSLVQKKKEKQQLLDAAQQQQKKLLHDFIRESGSAYLQRLVADGKNYQHILEREILTSRYPNAVLYKEYDEDKYQERNCPSPDNYRFLSEIKKLHPNDPCKLFWLKIIETEESDIEPMSRENLWAGCVVLVKVPYGFEIVYGYPEKYISEKQSPLTEEELAKANAISKE